MAELDPDVTVADVFKFLHDDMQDVQWKLPDEKDPENRSYLSGQLDFMERLDAFITK